MTLITIGDKSFHKEDIKSVDWNTKIVNWNDGKYVAGGVPSKDRSYKNPISIKLSDGTEHKTVIYKDQIVEYKNKIGSR